MNYVHIRWMIRRDMIDVLRIESACFMWDAWTEDDFVRCLRNRDSIGMVAEVGDKIVGFMVYTFHRERLHVLNFAVDPLQQRNGIGAAMVAKLVGKLNPGRRTRILLEVRESNLVAQKFFRQMGFRAIEVLREFYQDCDEDAYLMQYRIRANELQAASVVPTDAQSEREGK